MLPLLDELLGRVRSPRIRMETHMDWVADYQVADALLEYEARANLVVEKYDHVVICVYETAMFRAGVAIDVLRTHPMALVGGMLRVNPFFVPTDDFLEELRDRGPRPAGN